MDIDIRCLEPDDAAAAAALAQRVWQDYDRARGHQVRPSADAVETARRERVIRRHAEVDPDGAHGAWSEGELVGVGLARRREELWGLSLLLVAPETQGRGVGARLIDRALATARGTSTGLIVSSADPRAIARYRLAGFDLHPALWASGRVDPIALPSVAGARGGTDADLEWIDALGARLRGAGYGADLAVMFEQARLVVVAGDDAQGWAFVRGAEVMQVGASDTRCAGQVLAAALVVAAREGGEEEVVVRQLTAGREWALDVALAAGLRLAPAGPLCVRGRPPACSYLPDGFMF